jgi:hypothetical protein
MNRLRVASCMRRQTDAEAMGVQAAVVGTIHVIFGAFLVVPFGYSGS